MINSFVCSNMLVIGSEAVQINCTIESNLP